MLREINQVVGIIDFETEMMNEYSFNGHFLGQPG